MHVGDLEGASTNGGSTWQATVTIRIDAADHTPVAGAVVGFNWSGGYAGTGTCTTGADGVCARDERLDRKKFGTVTLTVTRVSHAITVSKP